MERTNRILERFPQFYQTWDPDSVITQLLTAVGKRIDEAEKDVDYILLSHWVDNASHLDLDKLGQLFNADRNPGETDEAYRSRLKRTVIEFRGGGTPQAICTAARMTLGLPPDAPIGLTENPVKVVRREFTVKSGDEWSFSSESIHDAEPMIEIKPESSETTVNPTLTNLDSGESLRFEGKVASGSRLMIEGADALLDGRDVSGSLTGVKPLRLPRRRTAWRYEEPISEEIGVFDTAVFDESKFAIGIPEVKVCFEWVAHQPATFELTLPESALVRENSLQLVREAVDSIKAAGVKAIITTGDVNP